MSSEPEIVPITQELAEAYFNGRPPYSFRGFAAVLDGIPVAVAGLFRAYNRLWAFCELKPEFRRFKKAHVRAARKLLPLLDAVPGAVYAVASPLESTAHGFLQHLRFMKTDEMFLGGNVYKYRRRGL